MDSVDLLVFLTLRGACGCRAAVGGWAGVESGESSVEEARSEEGRCA